MSKQTRKAKPAKTKARNAQSEEDFIPDDAVSSGSSSYMKLTKGENKFRIISKPITGWLEWVDKKPIHMQIDEEPEVTDDENKPKKFLAMAVIDREDEQVKILELTQQSVIKAIKALAANPDWGNPFGYDISVERTGEDLKTKYVVTPSPKKPLSKEAIKAAEAKPCYLDALYDSEDPWNVDEAEDVTKYFFK